MEIFVVGHGAPFVPNEGRERTRDVMSRGGIDDFLPSFAAGVIALRSEGGFSRFSTSHLGEGCS